MPTNDRHTEFFGPDFARGPFGSSNLDVAAISIAAAIAQVRAPLTRDDTEISDHAQFVRDLADIIAPETATFISIDFTPVTGGGTIVTFRANTLNRVLLRAWLADDYGGGVSNATPDDVTWDTGVELQNIDSSDKHFLVVTNNVGVAQAFVSVSSETDWYWGVARGSRVFYTGQMNVKP